MPFSLKPSPQSQDKTLGVAQSKPIRVASSGVHAGGICSEIVHQCRIACAWCVVQGWPASLNFACQSAGFSLQPPSATPVSLTMSRNVSVAPELEMEVDDGAAGPGEFAEAG